MIIIEKKSECTGCTACASICPKSLINMVEDNEGFVYPQITNEDRCIKCGKCMVVCPVKNSVVEDNFPTSYAIKNKDKSIQKQSSSGGAFTAFASLIIKNGGVVYGVSMDNFIAHHTKAENLNSLAEFRGSKYVQSDLQSTYKEIKEDLKKGITVMFSGTPCQVEGLILFLGKKYHNLITIDFSCHGVPSPKVLRLYLYNLEKKFGKKLSNVSFRDKNLTWRWFSFKAEFIDGSQFSEPLDKNLYLRGFTDNLFLRPSCYDCAFKKTSRVSDITVADFWGIQDTYPEYYDEIGVSLCCANSSRGLTLIKQASELLEINDVDFEKAVSRNSAYTCSVRPSNMRGWFFEHLDRVPIEKNIMNCLNPNLVTRIAIKLNRKK